MPPQEEKEVLPLTARTDEPRIVESISPVLDQEDDNESSCDHRNEEIYSPHQSVRNATGNVVDVVNDSDDANCTRQQQQQQQQQDRRDIHEGSHETEREYNRPPYPLNNASIISRLTFSWSYPLLKLGSSRPIEELDLPDLSKEDTSEFNLQRMKELLLMKDNYPKNSNDNRSSNSNKDHDKHVSTNYDRSLGKDHDKHDAKNYDEDKDNNNMSNNQKNDPNRLSKVLFHDYFRTTWLAQILLVIQMTGRIGQVIALGLLVSQFDDQQGPEQQPEENDINSSNDQVNTSSHSSSYLWASMLVICGAISFPAKQLLFFLTYRKGMQTRIGLVSSIYDKTLRLSSINRPVDSAGHVTNLASNDVERFLGASVYTIFILWGPIEAIAIVFVGLQIVGISFVIGLGFLLMVLLPLQVCLSQVFARLRSKVASRTDARMSWLTQAVSGARLVKYNAWEYELQRRIMQLRAQEVQQIKSSATARAINEATYYASSLSMSVVIFMFDILLGETLNPQKVYTVLALTNILQMCLTRLLPNAIMSLSECYVSCRRIQSFLDLPEKSDYVDEGKDGCEHRFEDYDDDDQDNADDKLKTDDIVDETLLSLSNVTCYWDEEKNNVALTDISQSFQRGRMYGVVGKVGSGKSALLLALSGQLTVSSGKMVRQYRSLSFSEQEPWIANGTVRENITMGISFDKTMYDAVIDSCALRLDLTSFTDGDMTIVGDRGITLSGGQKFRLALARVLYRDHDLLLLDDPFGAVDSNVAKRMVSGIQKLCIERNKTVIVTTHQPRYIANFATFIEMKNGTATKMPSNESFKVCYDTEPDKITDKTTKSPHAEQTLDDALDKSKSSVQQENSTKEKKATGAVTFATYRQYGEAVGGPLVCILLFVLFTATQVIFLWTIVIIGDWSEQPKSEQSSSSWLALVAGMTCTMIFLSSLRAVAMFRLLVMAAQRLHDRLLHSVLRARISWYDTQPLGRIMNRFSADIGIADDLLPLTVFDFLVGSFTAVGSIATAIVVLPFVLIVIPFISWGFIRLRQMFVRTTREIKRFEGMARSPVFALMSEALTGARTIQANGLTAYCQRNFQAAHDAHTRAYFAFVSTSRCFAFQIDLFAFILMSTASILSVLFRNQQWLDIDPATIGLALTLLLQLSQTNLPWIVRQSSEVTNHMVAIERILEYSRAPQERPFELPFDNDHQAWPTKTGTSIVFDNFSVRYRDELPLTLSNVGITIPPGKRVGIIGRTGSGKSTLSQSLYRLLEAETGSIVIDGLNISNLGLHKLRRSMSIVPQTPFLLYGTSIRENLDPFSKCNDDKMKDALSVVQLFDTINEGFPDGLDSVLTDGSLSVGQKQLLCLARTILSKTNILVMDEATAFVDVGTSDLIYKAIDKEFATEGCTILNIAHRLESILGYDLVLVLCKGQVDQFGSPKELLQDNHGSFYKMVESQGLLEKMMGIE